jgi:hypothetical protein
MSSDSLTPARLLLYVSIALLLPFFFVFQHFKSEGDQLEQLEQTLTLLEGDILLKEKKQAQNKAVRAHFKDSDHFFIDKYLEPISLLERESQSIVALFEQPIPLSEPVKKRYEFLTSGQNGISFVEGQVKSYPSFQETLETLSHPIELDLDDLKKLLTLIEGTNLSNEPTPPGRPHLLITEFKLDKKEGFKGREHFLLHLKILKREYL